MNRDLAAAWAFHDATKYVAIVDEAGQEQLRMGTPPNVEDLFWEQDWSVEPYPYKEYETLEPIGLPREFPASGVPALEVLSRTGSAVRPELVPGRSVLARIGLLSNGLLNRTTSRGRGQIVEFRTAGGTGARYHLELYFVCGDLPDLAAGVYHYSVRDHSLRRLRSGDFRGALVRASGGEPALSRAPVVLAMSSTFWRNAWRYKARAYRHTYWDAGTSMAHVLAIAESSGIPAKVVLGYADDEVNAVVGADGTRESVIALCALGEQANPGAATADGLTPLVFPTRPISEWEVEFPAITAMHKASCLPDGEQAAMWREIALRRTPPEPSRELIGLEPLPFEALGSLPVEELILRRRSTRRYDTTSPLSFTAFSTLLDRSSRGFSADCLVEGALPLHDLYLIVNSVEGIPPGAYVYHPRRKGIELLREGNFRDAAARLALNQTYAADAHVNAYYLTDLTPVLECYGNRGYRLAQLECSLHAGKLHLGTHALGLGAVGSTSFDDEVTEFFSPHSAGKSYMFVTVFGVPRRRTSGSVA